MSSTNQEPAPPEPTTTPPDPTTVPEPTPVSEPTTVSEPTMGPEPTPVTTPPPSYVKLAMRNMVRKGRQSLLHFGLTAVGLATVLLLLAWFARPSVPGA